MERVLKVHNLDQKNNLGKSVQDRVQSVTIIHFSFDQNTNCYQNEKEENYLKTDKLLKQRINDRNEITRNQQEMIEKCLENEHQIETVSEYSIAKKDDDVKGKLDSDPTDVSCVRQDANPLFCTDAGNAFFQIVKGKTIDQARFSDEFSGKKREAKISKTGFHLDNHEIETYSCNDNDVKVKGELDSDPASSCQIGKGANQLGKDVGGTFQQVTLVTKGIKFDQARQQNELSGKERCKSPNIDLHLIEVDPTKEISIIHSSNTKAVKDLGMLHSHSKSVFRYPQGSVPQTCMDAGDTPQRMAFGLESLRKELSCKNPLAPCFDDSFNKEKSVNLLVLANRYLNEHLKNGQVFSVLQEIYTSPLDQRPFYELWRLSTFAPCVDLEVSVIRLSQSGFYYEDSTDNIICFSCNLSKRKWTLGDKAVDVRHLKLSRQCKQTLRLDTRNVPVIHEQSLRRGRSDPACSRTVPQSSLRTSHPYAVQEGSEDSKAQVGFPIEISEITALTSKTQPPQDGVSECPTGSNQQRPLCPISSACELQTDSDQHAWLPVQEDHNPSAAPSISSDHFTSSEVGQITRPGSEDVEYGPVRPEDSRIRAEGDTVTGLDMRLAVCPEYQSQRAREASFSSWPPGDLPLPNDLASAGFYYMGIGDSVRCFYCGVNLKNWRRGDDPWATHVRFRFSCGYVTAVKGEDFAQQVMRHGDATTETSAGANSTQGLSIPSTPSSSAPQPAGDTGRQAPRPAPRTSRETSSPADLASSPRSHLAPAGCQSQREPASPQREPASPQPGLPVDVRRSSSSRSATTVIEADSEDLEERAEQLAETHRQLWQQRTCRVCRWREVDVIFLPCGHLCTCSSCAGGVTLCCLCRERVLGTAHVILE